MRIPVAPFPLRFRQIEQLQRPLQGGHIHFCRKYKTNEQNYISKLENYHVNYLHSKKQKRSDDKNSNNDHNHIRQIILLWPSFYNNSKINNQYMINLSTKVQSTYRVQQSFPNIFTITILQARSTEHSTYTDTLTRTTYCLGINSFLPVKKVWWFYKSSLKNDVEGNHTSFFLSSTKLCVRLSYYTLCTSFPHKKELSVYYLSHLNNKKSIQFYLKE